MDDLIVCAETWDQHKALLAEMFQSLINVGLTLKPSKAKFGPAEVKYLGYVISPHGIKVGDDRIEAITSIPPPQNIKQLRSFLGAVSFVRKFIRDYSTVIEPLEALTRKEFARHKTFENVWNLNAYSGIQSHQTPAYVSPSTCNSPTIGENLWCTWTQAITQQELS